MAQISFKDLCDRDRAKLQQILSQFTKTQRQNDEYKREIEALKQEHQAEMEKLQHENAALRNRVQRLSKQALDLNKSCTELQAAAKQSAEAAETRTKSTQVAQTIYRQREPPKPAAKVSKEVQTVAPKTVQKQPVPAPVPEPPAPRRDMSDLEDELKAHIADQIRQIQVQARRLSPEANPKPVSVVSMYKPLEESPLPPPETLITPQVVRETESNQRQTSMYEPVDSVKRIRLAGDGQSDFLREVLQGLPDLSKLSTGEGKSETETAAEFKVEPIGTSPYQQGRAAQQAAQKLPLMQAQEPIKRPAFSGQQIVEPQIAITKTHVTPSALQASSYGDQMAPLRPSAIEKTQVQIVELEARRVSPGHRAGAAQLGREEKRQAAPKEESPSKQKEQPTVAKDEKTATPGQKAENTTSNSSGTPKQAAKEDLLMNKALERSRTAVSGFVEQLGEQIELQRAETARAVQKQPNARNTSLARPHQALLSTAELDVQYNALLDPAGAPDDLELQRRDRIQRSLHQIDPEELDSVLSFLQTGKL